MNGISVKKSHVDAELVLKFYKTPVKAETEAEDAKPEEKATYVAGYGLFVGHTNEGTAAGGNDGAYKVAVKTDDLGIALENNWK